MNRKKTPAVLALLSCFLAVFVTVLSREAAAQALAIPSNRHGPQTGISQSLDPAVPESPQPSLASSAEVQSHPSDTFKLKILVMSSAGEPAPGAMLFISFPNSGETPVKTHTGDRGYALLDLRDAELALPDAHGRTSGPLVFRITATWDNPTGGPEYLQTSVDQAIDRSAPSEITVTAKLSSMDTYPPDPRVNPCFLPGQLNTHLFAQLWTSTAHPEQRWEGEIQIGELNALVPPPNTAIFRLSVDHLVSFESMVQLGLGWIRSAAYDVQGSGVGSDFTSGYLNNGIYDIYATVEIVPVTRQYRCYAIPYPADPNVGYMPVSREEIRVNRIMGLTPKKRQRNGVLEIQQNYLSFAIVDRDYACSKMYPANFTTNAANTISYGWSYQSNQWEYWQNELSASFANIGMGVRFKGGSGTTTQVRHDYTFVRPSNSNDPSVWWAYRAEPGQCNLMASTRVMLTNDKALQNACGLPWMPQGASQDAAAASEILMLPAEACSVPPTPEPLPYMDPESTVTPTPPPSLPTATPTAPPSGNLPAPDIRGGQLPDSTDWRLYLNNWNDVMVGGRYVTHITNPPDWQDPDPNPGCLMVSLTQPFAQQPQAPFAACWPRGGELDVSCGRRLEARTFDGSGNSSRVGEFSTGACPPGPTHCLGDFVWNDANRNGRQDGGETGLASIELLLFREDGGGLWNTVTDANGRYQFCGLRDGEHMLKVYRPLGYSCSLKDQGLDDAVDSDVDSLGEVGFFFAGSDQWQWDAGLYPESTSTPTYTPTHTATPSATASPTRTAPSAATPTATRTPTPTATRTPTPAPTVTATSAPLASVYADAALGTDSPTCGASAGAAACRSISFALANRVAAGGTVAVAAATYNERLTLRPGVKVLGAGAAITTLNGGGGGPVVTADDAAIDASAVLSGFTITGGQAASGAGITIRNGAAPVIEQNVIEGNTADYGGALHLDTSSATVRNNIIQNNSGVYNAGGVYIWQGAPTISGNTIRNNDSDWGGGMFINHSRATVSSNTIQGNTAAAGGGGIYVFDYATAAITGNIIINNQATGTDSWDGGGGMAIGVDCSSTVSGNVLRGNSAAYGGGLKINIDDGNPAGTLTAHGNIICGNGGHQFYNETAAVVDVIGNWWGTNAPGATQLSGPATYSPAIALSLGASPTTVILPGASIVQASLQGGGYRVPNGTSFTWSTTLGALDPASSATTNGSAQTSLAGAAAGAASVTVGEPCGFTASAMVNFVTSSATATPTSVPATPTRTASPTATRTPTAAPTATRTSTPVIATVTPTNSPVPATVTPTKVAIATSVTFQQGASGYGGTSATYFDGSGNGYNSAAYLRVDNTGSQRALVRFNLSSLPGGTTIQAATLSLYWYGSSNANSLTVAAHRVLANWVDSQATRTYRKTGIPWVVARMGAGKDYNATADGAATLGGTAGKWVNIDVTEMAQLWVQNATFNNGLVLLEQAASGNVTASFCSELGWSPCTAAQAPKLTVTYLP